MVFASIIRMAPPANVLMKARVEDGRVAQETIAGRREEGDLRPALVPGEHSNRPDYRFGWTRQHFQLTERAPVTGGASG